MPFELGEPNGERHPQLWGEGDPNAADSVDEPGRDVSRAFEWRTLQDDRKLVASVARYGGDEFAVILKSSPLEGARNVATRFINAVRSIRIPLAPELRVTLSIGLSKLERHDDVESFISRADEALYEAKRAGRDGFAG